MKKIEDYHFKRKPGHYRNGSRMQLYNAEIQALRTKLDAWSDSTVLDNLEAIQHLDASVDYARSTYLRPDAHTKIRISLDKIEVFEQHRQQGIGKQVLTSLLQFAQQEQRNVWLLVSKDASKQWIREWYGRLGFIYRGYGEKGCYKMLWTFNPIETDGDTPST